MILGVHYSISSSPLQLEFQKYAAHSFFTRYRVERHTSHSRYDVTYICNLVAKNTHHVLAMCLTSFPLLFIVTVYCTIDQPAGEIARAGPLKPFHTEPRAIQNVTILLRKKLQQ